MKRFSSMVIITAIALFATACAGSEGDSNSGGDDVEEMPTVIFQGVQGTESLPLFVMQEEGIDEKHGFTAEYLQVDFDAATSTFLLGESDISMEQDPLNLAVIQQEGHHAVAFLPIINLLVGMIVEADSPYESPQDLVGKRVAHYGIDSGAVAHHAVMLKDLYDIDVFNDYELVESGFGALGELLMQGEVDAVIHAEPFAIQQGLDEAGRYVFQPVQAWRDHTDWAPQIATLSARVEWLEENPDLARQVRDAWLEAMQVIIDSDYEILKEEPARSLLAFEDDAQYESFIEYCQDLPCMNTDWGQAEIDRWNDYIQLFVDEGVLLEEVPEAPVAVELDQFLEGQ